MKILKPSEFQMPDECLSIKQKINFYKFWRKQWDWDGNNINQRLDTSGLKIRSYLINQSLISDEKKSERFVGDTFKARLDFLKLKLKTASKTCINNINNIDNHKSELFDAFIAIQLWGGSEGRHVFENNFKNLDKAKEWNEVYFDPYLKIIKTLKNNDEFKLNDIIEQTSVFNNFKISFLSKHLHFWSIEEDIKVKLPIYDSMVYDVLFAANTKQGQKNKHYDHYCTSLIKKSKELNCGLNNIDLEKALFSYSKKIGVVRNNKVPILFQNQKETIIVNDFLNSRITLKKVRRKKDEASNLMPHNTTSYKIIIVSKSGDKYEITKIDGKLNCTCKSFKFRKNNNCKHIAIILELSE